MKLFLYLSFFFVSASAVAEELLFRPGNLIPESRTEIKWFNNLYTQTKSFDDGGTRTDVPRSSYLTSIVTANHGVTPRLNLGADLYYKALLEANGQKGLTTFNPRVKWVPFEGIPALIFSSTFVFPLRSDLEGAASGRPFLEFNGWQWWNQVLTTLSFSEAVYLYMELGAFYRFNTALPNPKHGFTTPLKIIPHLLVGDFTLYLPLELGPSWSDLSWQSYYTQVGVGLKYQVNEALQLETLFTLFPAGRNAGAGISYNLGLRYVL